MDSETIPQEIIEGEPIPDVEEPMDPALDETEPMSPEQLAAIQQGLADSLAAAGAERPTKLWEEGVQVSFDRNAVAQALQEVRQRLAMDKVNHMLLSRKLIDPAHVGKKSNHIETLVRDLDRYVACVDLLSSFAEKLDRDDAVELPLPSKIAVPGSQS